MMDAPRWTKQLTVEAVVARLMLLQIDPNKLLTSTLPQLLACVADVHVAVPYAAGGAGGAEQLYANDPLRVPLPRDSLWRHGGATHFEVAPSPLLTFSTNFTWQHELQPAALMWLVNKDNGWARLWTQAVPFERYSYGDDVMQLASYHDMSKWSDALGAAHVQQWNEMDATINAAVAAAAPHPPAAAVAAPVLLPAAAAPPAPLRVVEQPSSAPTSQTGTASVTPIVTVASSSASTPLPSAPPSPLPGA